MSTRVTSTRLIGRQAELAELEAALSDASAGRASLAFVAGESGVGKTRLLSELVARARARGANVLSGDCVELGEGELPYAPIVAALRPLARARDPVLGALAAADREALARLLPGMGGTSAPEGGERAQGQLFEALLSLLELLGREDGLVLAIEDLHWADRSTRAFLAFLGRMLCDERVLVVASYRSDELHRRHPLRPLLAEMERDARAARIELTPLSRPEFEGQLADILGAPPERALAERLWTRGGGNPLFTEELLAAGLDGRGPAPATLRDALMVRVERLGEPAQEVLRLLAAAQRLDHAMLAEASGLEPGELRAALREAAAGHILTADEEGNYAFRHALLREVVHDDLLPGEHAELHRALAAAFERRLAAEGNGAHLTAAAAHHHFAAGDRPGALAASVRAAEAAERVHAHGEALALLERALELWPAVPDAERLAGADRVELLSRAARAADGQGESARPEARATAALREIDPHAEPRRAATLLERLARGQRRSGHADVALETIRKGLELLPADRPCAERARLLSLEGKIRMLQGRYGEAVRVSREALRAAREVEDPIAESRALNALGVSLATSGEPEEGIAALEAVTEMVQDGHPPSDIAEAYANLADTLFVLGRDAEALAVAEQGLAHDGMSRSGAGWLSVLVAEVAIERGDWRTAAARLPAFERLTGSTAVHAGLRLAQLDLGRGEEARARERLLAIAPAVEGSGESQFHGPFGALTAELERRAGDVPAARAAVDAALDCIEYCSDDGLRLAQVAVAGVAVEGDAAALARDLGDVAAVAEAEERAARLLERVEAATAAGQPVERAMLATARADATRVAGAGDPAAAAAAAAAWEALDRPYPAAVMRWREAEAHVARADREAAGAVAGPARETAAALGATWLLGELDGLIARARLPLAPRAAEGSGPQTEPAAGEPHAELPFGLTPREHQVLALLARGATNREIGAELYMAEKTASVHVSRILAKLDARTRTEAAAVAHRHGLDLTAPETVRPAPGRRLHA